MRCHRCGSEALYVVAPNVWQCAGTIATPGGVVGGPGLTNPSLGPGLMRVPDTYRTCNTTVTVEESTLSDDDKKLHDRFMADYTRAASAVAARVGEAASALASLDPNERLVVAIRQYAFTGGFKPPTHRGEWWNSLRPDWPVLKAAFPETFLASEKGHFKNSFLVHSPWWDHDLIREWFLSMVVAPPITRLVSYNAKTWLGAAQRRTREVRGWTLEFAVQPTVSYQNLSETIFLTVDGKYAVEGFLLKTDPRPGFNANGLRQIADLLDLPSVQLLEP